MRSEPVYLAPTKATDLCNREECEECAFRGQGRAKDHCRILVDTRFGNRVCPFSKTEDEKHADEVKARERLMSIGWKAKTIDHFFW